MFPNYEQLCESCCSSIILGAWVLMINQSPLDTHPGEGAFTSNGDTFLERSNVSNITSENRFGQEYDRYV